LTKQKVVGELVVPGQKDDFLQNKEVNHKIMQRDVFQMQWEMVIGGLFLTFLEYGSILNYSKQQNMSLVGRAVHNFSSEKEKNQKTFGIGGFSILCIFLSCGSKLRFRSLPAFFFNYLRQLFWYLIGANNIH